MLRNTNIFWGAVFLILGGLFLVDSLGVVDLNLWRVIWPIMLILMGLWVLMGYFYKSERVAGEPAYFPLDNARSATIQFHHGAGRLTVGAGAGPMDLVSGTFLGGVDSHTRRVGDHLDLTLKVKDSGFPVVVFPWFWSGQNQLEWNLNISDEIPLELKFKTGASDTCLVLTDLQVEKLRVDTGASKTEIHLPDNVSYTKVVMKSGVASVSIFVPEDVSARIRTTGGLMDARVDRNRFPKSGGYFQSPDYETAIHKVEIFVDMGVGSVMIQ